MTRYEMIHSFIESARLAELDRQRDAAPRVTIAYTPLVYGETRRYSVFIAKAVPSTTEDLLDYSLDSALAAGLSDACDYYGADGLLYENGSVYFMKSARSKPQARRIHWQSGVVCPGRKIGYDWKTASSLGVTD